MKVLLRILTDIDMISPSPQMLVEGRKVLKSTMGGFTTAVTGIAFCIMFILLAQKVLNREEPNVVYSVKYKELSNFTLLKDVMFATGLVLPDGSSIEDSESVYEVHMFHELLESKLVDGEMIINPIITKLNVTKCNLEHFGHKKKIFEKARYNDYYCVDQNSTNSEILLLNPYANPDKTFSDIYVALTRCSNETGKVCKSDEEINKILKSYVWEFAISDFYIDHDNFETPSLPYARKMLFFSSISLYKSVEFFFKDFSYTDDSGLVFSELKTHVRPTLDYTTNTVSLESMGLYLPNQIGDAYLAYNPRGFHDYYQRHYKKLQDVMVSVGGIIKVFYLFFQGLTTIVSNNNFYDYLLKSNYKIIKSEELPSFTQYSRVHSRKEITTTTSAVNQVVKYKLASATKSNKNLQTFNNNNQNNDKILELLEESKKSVFVKYYQIYNIFGCIKQANGGRKGRNLNNILKLCQEKLEMKNIIKIQTELDLIKPILLTDEKSMKRFCLLSPYEHYFQGKQPINLPQSQSNNSSPLDLRIDALCDLFNRA